MIIVRKIYRSKQLRRDITSELESITQQYASTQSKVELARSLSILLRRASITYHPNHDVAGMTGDSWLHWLDSWPDKRHGKRSQNTGMKAGFDSDTGKILLTAPYLPDNSTIDYDAKALIELCESWLLASHKARAHTAGAQAHRNVEKTAGVKAT